MLRGMIGKKLGMTQIFNDEGSVIPVTVLQVGPCRILELKDSPSKVKLGFGDVKESRLTKPELGYFRKLNVQPSKVLKEFVSTDNSEYEVGQELKADFFKPGDYVDVTGTSIGKGFQGGMKRWGWSGGPASHGSNHKRRVGSIGQCAYPSRVFKGFHMPGQMGNEQKTIQGLRVMRVDAEKNLVMVQGGVPGSKRSVIFIKRSQKKAFRSLDEKKAVVVRKVNPMKQSKAKAKGKGK